MILCIGSIADDTFTYTVRALRHGRLAVQAIDLAEIVMLGDVEVRFHDALASSLVIGATRYILKNYTGVFARLLDLATEAPTERLARRATNTFYALTRLFNLLPGRVVNPPGRDLANYAKVFHSATLAVEMGWRIPRSCLTNDPQIAAEFIKECDGAVIFKGASAVKTWATQYDPALHAFRLPLLCNCPVLFQELISGPDVRVHVVGGDISAELIHSEVVDYRTTRANRFSAVTPPEGSAEGCRSLTKLSGIPFLGIDFKTMESTGAWYFLEANSMPCYQGYDLRAGGAISRALVNWLSALSCF
jgi:glutathione synthase/RimK-type ligase-like ATP-grasp enzyme